MDIEKKEGDESPVKAGSELLAEVFNRMTTKQKNSVPPKVAERIGHFMVDNGYRLVFSRWYLQTPPAA